VFTPYGTDPVRADEPPSGMQGSVILISAHYFADFTPPAPHKGYAMVTDA